MAETSCIVKLLADATEIGTSDDTLEEIAFPTSEIEAIEIKSLCAASKTFLAGQQNNGTLDFTVHYSPVLNTTLEGFLGVSKTWKVQFNASQEATFTGILTKHQVVVGGQNEYKKIACSVIVSGDITLGAPA